MIFAALSWASACCDACKCVAGSLMAVRLHSTARRCCLCGRVGHRVTTGWPANAARLLCTAPLAAAMAPDARCAASGNSKDWLLWRWARLGSAGEMILGAEPWVPSSSILPDPWPRAPYIPTDDLGDRAGFGSRPGRA